jgi:hypothetical protein
MITVELLDSLQKRLNKTKTLDATDIQYLIDNCIIDGTFDVAKEGRVRSLPPETNFVPGPWKLDLKGNGKEIFIDGGDDYVRLDCRISKDDCDVDAALATAHLVSAAPDMYKALLMMLAGTPGGVKAAKDALWKAASK